MLICNLTKSFLSSNLSILSEISDTLYFIISSMIIVSNVTQSNCFKCKKSINSFFKNFKLFLFIDLKSDIA